jgi:DNA mismatch endonuclease Vsr
MSGVRTKHTGPELKVRSVAHGAGYRFALHRKDLPGKPDIVFPRFKSVVFVHGCFWHQHKGCSKSTLPATRRVLDGKTRAQRRPGYRKQEKTSQSRLASSGHLGVPNSRGRCRRSKTEALFGKIHL